MISTIEKASNARAWDEMMVLAKSLEPILRRAFITAAVHVRSTVKLKELARLIEEGQFEAVARLIAGEQAGAARAISIGAVGGTAYRGLLPAMQQVLATAAAPQMRRINRLLRVTLHPDAFNPFAVELAREFSGTLIAEITDGQLAAARALLADALRVGQPPIAQARDLRMLIGLTRKQQQYVLNYRRELEAGDLNALGRQLRDRRSDAKILRMFQAGERLPFAEVRRLTQRYADRWLQHRAQTIARTESINAASEGGRLAWLHAVAEEAIEEGSIRRKWYLGPPDRVCPVCRPIPRMNPDGRGLREPFATPVGPKMGPTVHTSCRCAVFIRPV